MTIRNNFDNFRNSDSDTIVVSKLSRKQNAVRVIHFGRFWRKLLGFIFWRSMQPKGWPPAHQSFPSDVRVRYRNVKK
jgi:thiamine transporter ThiT